MNRSCPRPLMNSWKSVQTTLAHNTLFGFCWLNNSVDHKFMISYSCLIRWIADSPSTIEHAILDGASFVLFLEEYIIIQEKCVVEVSEFEQHNFLVWSRWVNVLFVFFLSYTLCVQLRRDNMPVFLGSAIRIHHAFYNNMWWGKD